MANSPQDVYARNLISHRGYPLWTPEPNIELPGGYQQAGLKIGDVGVIVPEEGSFDVFFNITLPREHPLHAADGVPNNFNQMELRRGDYRILPDAESPDRVISSAAIECTISCIDPLHLDGAARRRTDYQFVLRRNEGAMLILPQGAERHRLAKELLFLDVILQNAVEWYRFARERLYRDINNDALYLITGFHKAKSWSLASFNNTRASSVQSKIVQLEKGGPIVLDDSTWVSIYPLEWRIGPRISDESRISNQSVFIIGFKIAVNEELLHLKRVTVKVGHSDRTLATALVGFGSILANLLYSAKSSLTYSSGSRVQDDPEEADEPTSEHGPPEDEHEPVRVERIPQVLQPFHPSDIINRYLLKMRPSAKIAITHDSQWIALLEKGILTQRAMLQDGRLEEVISREYSITTKNGAVYLEDNNEQMRTSTTTYADYHRTNASTSRLTTITDPTSSRGPARPQHTTPPQSTVDRAATPRQTQPPSKTAHIRMRSETANNTWKAGPPVSRAPRPPLVMPVSQKITPLALSDEADLDVFVVGPTGLGKSTLLDMIMASPGNLPSATGAAYDMRPRTDRSTTVHMIHLKGGLRCRVWDTKGIDGVTEDGHRLMEGMAEISRSIRERLPRRVGKLSGASPSDQTQPVLPILMWCIDASQIRVRIHWLLFRRMYVHFCKRMVTPVIVVTEMVRDATGWETECKRQLQRLDLRVGSDHPDIPLLRIRKHDNVSSLKYKEDCQAVGDLIARLATRQEVPENDTATTTVTG